MDPALDSHLNETKSPRRPVIRTCRHVLESGSVCRAAAGGGRPYCRAHLLSRLRRRKMARARRRPDFLRLAPPVEMAAIRHGAARTLAAMAKDQIDSERGRSLLSLLGMAAAKLSPLKKRGCGVQVAVISLSRSITYE